MEMRAEVNFNMQLMLRTAGDRVFICISKRFPRLLFGCAGVWVSFWVWECLDKAIRFPLWEGVSWCLVNSATHTCSQAHGLNQVCSTISSPGMGNSCSGGKRMMLMMAPSVERSDCCPVLPHSYSHTHTSVYRCGLTVRIFSIHKIALEPLRNEAARHGFL